MIEKLKDGCGVGARIAINGNYEEFGLAVLLRKDFIDMEAREPENDWKHYEYGFINNDSTLYFKGLYSGGVTGFGQNSLLPINEEWYSHYMIITKDVHRAIEIAEESENKQKSIENERIQKALGLMEKINALPEKFSIGWPSLDEKVEFRRSKAVYREGRFVGVHGGNISLYRKDGSEINICHYVSKSGQFLTRKFDDLEMKYAFPESQLSARAVLELLVNRQKELEKMINDVKYDRVQ